MKMLKFCCESSTETHVHYTVFCVAYTVSRFALTDYYINLSLILLFCSPYSKHGKMWTFILCESLTNKIWINFGTKSLVNEQFVGLSTNI